MFPTGMFMGIRWTHLDSIWALYQSNRGMDLIWAPCEQASRTILAIVMDNVQRGRQMSNRLYINWYGLDYTERRIVSNKENHVVFHLLFYHWKSSSNVCWFRLINAEVYASENSNVTQYTISMVHLQDIFSYGLRSYFAVQFLIPFIFLVIHSQSG